MKTKLLKKIVTVTKYALIGTILQSLLFTGLIASDGNAQTSLEDIYISTQIGNFSVMEVFSNIENSTDFHFAYRKSIIDKRVKISLSGKKEMSVANLLRQVSQDAELKFKRVNDVIHVGINDGDKELKEEFTAPLYQSMAVHGKVTSDDSPDGIPGVNVVLKGTVQGSVTDVNGDYQIEVPSSESVLVFSSVGFTTQEIIVGNQTEINVHLALSINSLMEVVVIGYGESNTKDLTSSITTVKSDEIVKTPTGQAMQALQGKVAGMQVVSSGSPGESPTVRIRGIGSYPGRENEAPLFVVDGMFFDNIDFLNTNDIATISVMKDASAAAIYGVRAANGVVLIETKSGSYNQQAEIDYSGYYGTQVAQNVLKMANAEQFTNMANESGSAADAGYILNAMQRYGRSRINPNVPDVNTDWYKEILRPASIQNHSLNITGGSQNTTYSIGGSYFGQQGILDMKNEYERFNLRSKIDYKATDWLTVGGNIIWSNALRYPEEGAAWNQSYFAIPIMPIYDEENLNATPDNFASAQLLGYRGGQNPFPALTYNHRRQKIRKILTNFYVQLELIPDKLTFKSAYNHSSTDLDTREVFLPYYITDGFQRADASLLKRSEIYFNQIWDNVLTYTNNFGAHYLTVMAGTSYRDESYEKLEARGLNFPVDQVEAWYLAQAETIVVDNVTDDGRRQYGISYFGRISYNFDDRYLLYGTMRADGSSKYQEKWGYFPTVGAGWVISEENFLANNSFINFLKLRGSWGQLGNDKIQASDGAITTEVITTAIDGVLVTGNKTASTYSSLEWEVTEEWNVGLTSRIFNNRLFIDADYYIRDTENAAIYVNIPAIGGTVLRNVGIIRNSGFELGLDWKEDFSNGLSYYVGANISTLKNEVRDLYGQPYIDGGSAEFRQRSIIGEPLLAFFGREVIGVYQNDEEIQNDPVAVENGLEPGDFKYKDQNGDGLIDDDDRVVLGSYFPSFMYGFNIGASYKNIEFSANFFGQSGNKILNRKRGELIWTSDGNLDADLAINRWHGEGTSDEYPSSKGLRKGWNQKMSNYFVEDGSFFRIQNVNLAYNFVEKEVFGVPIPDIRISLTAERPLTLFNYNGFNPEVEDGIDTQTYPIPAVYTVGLNVKF